MAQAKNFSQYFQRVVKINQPKNTKNKQKIDKEDHMQPIKHETFTIWGLIEKVSQLLL